MKKGKVVGQYILEGIGAAIGGLVVNGFMSKFSERKTKNDPDSKLVADLTVGELKKILKEGA